jgi:hypothetical protein
VYRRMIKADLCGRTLRDIGSRDAAPALCIGLGNWAHLVSVWRLELPSHPGKGHAYPYFKVQVYDCRTFAWKDHRKEAFDDEETARAYQEALGDNVTSRIMRWDALGAKPLGN